MYTGGGGVGGGAAAAGCCAVAWPSQAIKALASLAALAGIVVSQPGDGECGCCGCGCCCTAVRGSTRSPNGAAAAGDACTLVGCCGAQSDGVAPNR